MTQDLIDLHSTCGPGRGQFTIEQVDGLGVLVAFIQLDHRGQYPVVIRIKLFECGVLDPVFFVGNRSTVEVHLLFQPRGVTLEVLGILGRKALPFFQPEHRLNTHITVGPRTTNHRAVVQPWQRVVTHAGFAAFDLQQPGIRDDHHQQHDGDNYRKARQNALAQRPVLHSQSSGAFRNAGSIAEGAVSFIRRLRTTSHPAGKSRDGLWVGTFR
ncbi:hypothetical protein D3C73_612660 [compost metagenome]